MNKFEDNFPCYVQHIEESLILPSGFINCKQTSNLNDHIKTENLNELLYTYTAESYYTAETNDTNGCVLLACRIICYKQA